MFTIQWSTTISTISDIAEVINVAIEKIFQYLRVSSHFNYFRYRSFFSCCLELRLEYFVIKFRAMSKVTQYMPTPMTLSCFCEECRSLDRGKSSPSRHCYDLYGVIMHLGPNMAGGHYIAYVKTTVNLECYRTCGAREKARKMSNLSSDSGKSNNHKGNNILYNLFKNKGNNSSSNNINEKIFTLIIFVEFVVTFFDRKCRLE